MPYDESTEQCMYERAEQEAAELARVEYAEWLDEIEAGLPLPEECGADPF